jgi:hypothetical protein
MVPVGHEIGLSILALSQYVLDGHGMGSVAPILIDMTLPLSFVEHDITAGQ